MRGYLYRLAFTLSPFFISIAVSYLIGTSLICSIWAGLVITYILLYVWVMEDTI